MKKNVILRCGFSIFIFVFSLKGFAQNNGDIKIKIADFKVQEENNKISINWTAGAEIRTNYFEVEKSNDGKNFRTLAYVLGADPSKNNCDCYSYLDRLTTNKAELFYRIKHIYKNGEVEFSETETLDIQK